MPSEQGRKKSLRLDLTQATALEAPPSIAALFLIRFDIKTGYVISWKRSLPDVELEGVVEYRSLPSGLHNVTEDLVYFIHDKYAGVSAFVNKPAAEAERNALMFAVGVLVPLSNGRLGKSWRHAAGLKELAQKLDNETWDPQPLLEYWENHQVGGSDSPTLVETSLESPTTLKPRTRPDASETQRWSRALSDTVTYEASRTALTPFHPAASLPEFIRFFGPLVFPLYRAALLRKRILFVTEAPVHIPCNYVYDLSLLSSLPQSLLPLLPSEGLPPLRPRPLFNIGVHDIPYLSSLKPATGSGEHHSWIACTTDNVLTMKSELHDVLVTFPPPYSKDAAQKVYPKISIKDANSVNQKSPQQITIKATQRDVRRYLNLRDGLRHLDREAVSQSPNADDDSDASSTFSSSSIVEPLSWPRLAYTSFIWWASAGEKREGLTEEEEEQVEQDTSLLASVDSLSNSAAGSLHRRNIQLDQLGNQPQEVALVAYFRRLTSLIFTTLSDAVARQDADDEAETSYRDEPGEDDDETVSVNRHSTDDDQTALLSESRRRRANGDDDLEPVTITTEDMAHMGLDVWSETDRIFVDQLLRLWWGRKARVDGTRITCCGVRIL
ncbi:hypothetical protein C8Q69DRAFT_226464 [Paecilomyces variotii]|uniref:DUF4484 domain-containing protein n=1 Tax=Byssochlamys spectabilis TaxID=264951 RepID=A0A443HVV5_BYSSP|nr:hypothetical protein C8Q69DRAFT_226464 [Paecilomyces variotii]KAJ9221327.1 hypothetical protein DTO169C6_6315 [Paecilomyces variotii]KAJ9352604.1 hypothetical protein DTO280E4_7726 [Paecilomyces variotii]KAJ9404893.1 hypothetical protein DTO045G8_7357 [Paecilomyces variotii]RWQ95969.1 hypothetical protein C8Q69DRAFT_226464 [Paecilomyces variotii]